MHSLMVSAVDYLAVEAKRIRKQKGLPAKVPHAPDVDWRGRAGDERIRNQR